MIKVKFLRNIRVDYGENIEYKQGEVYELEDLRAEDFINANFCKIEKERAKRGAKDDK